MKSIKIVDSYKTWETTTMEFIIQEECIQKYKTSYVTTALNRTWRGMFLEWWLHNIGYYVTKPFCWIEYVRKINLRCKDVDLEEHK